MNSQPHAGIFLLLTSAWLAVPSPVACQQTGAIHGRVTLASSGAPLHHADVMIPRLGRKTESDDEGSFRFASVPPGRYEVVAHLHGLSDVRKDAHLTAASEVRVDFALELAAVREQITVTASGKTETSLESFLAVTSLGSLDLAARSGSTSLGDLLADQAGVSKRSFGPGTTRPVIRGFDGDRVLVLEDGVRTGTLSSQSGDHGEPVDPGQIERLEVVRGPATLLYGSNAIGGVVNAISADQEVHESPHAGLAGNLGATGGTANSQGGSSGNIRYGAGAWLLWGGGGFMRTGDYGAPSLGTIQNSGTRLENGRFGLGRSTGHSAFRLGYSEQQGRYGIPFAHAFVAQEPGSDSRHDEDVDLAFRRRQVRFTGNIRDFGGAFEDFTVKLAYSDWSHRELEGDEIGTRFSNKQLIYRGEFTQRRAANLTGSFGFWGMQREFSSRGEEALSPPVDQNAFALFALEQLDFERVRFQFGGRIERNSYSPRELDRRSFTGASGGAGVSARLWRGGVAVANYTRSFRAASLEELYYHGPHLGNLAFEIGNSRLAPERSNGLDLSLRHQGRRLQGEVNYFRYWIEDFVYLAPTGEIEDGLAEAEYRQAGAAFTGAEARLGAALSSRLWLSLSLDTVVARLRRSNRPLPRIPPLRGRAGIEYRHKGLSLRPELHLARRQDRVFTNEEPTAGYAVANFTASYSIARQHALHVFTANFFNVTDRLWRNHLSFIKSLAPEIGRGVRVGYSLYFY